MLIEPAADADRAAIDAFLAARADTSMFLRSNLRVAGLAWSGARFQAQYVIARAGGEIVGIAAHCWNGMLLVQADGAIEDLARAAVERSRRAVAGFSGPAAQVRAARAALGLAAAPARLDHDETLMALALTDLVIPPPLADGRVRVRHATAADRDPVAGWRADYLVDLSGSAPGPATDDEAVRWFDAAVAEHNLWLAEHAGEPVAITSFNARVPDCVQVGGVYTPPARRRRGHARAVVAASLLEARAGGVRRAILFTPRPDAVAAYLALGFHVTGSYGIVLLA